MPEAQIVLRGKAVVAAVKDYAANKAEADRLIALNVTHKLTIVAAMGNASIAECGMHIVRVTEVAESPAIPAIKITAAMIGRLIPAKKGRAASTRLEVI
jgi:hypothetical protein